MHNRKVLDSYFLVGAGHSKIARISGVTQFARLALAIVVPVAIVQAKTILSYSFADFPQYQHSVLSPFSFIRHYRFPKRPCMSEIHRRGHHRHSNTRLDLPTYPLCKRGTHKCGQGHHSLTRLELFLLIFTQLNLNTTNN